MPCPTCNGEVAPGATWRPFCSKRCKLVDLGRWLDGAYSLPGDEAGAEELDEAIEETMRRERNKPSSTN